MLVYCKRGIYLSSSVCGIGLRLLSDGEVQYVTQAISAFMKANPEIPVNRASFQMLKSGVGVHHAGLIPVWKAFIEDLFNANKIKVLFATETLAAGMFYDLFIRLSFL